MTGAEDEAGNAENAALVKKVSEMSDADFAEEMKGVAPEESFDKMKDADFGVLRTVVGDVLKESPQYDLNQAMAVAYDRKDRALGVLGNRETFEDYVVVEVSGRVGGGKTRAEAIRNAIESAGD